MDLDPYALKLGAIKLIILVCSLTLHEWGHAIAAHRLGDDTPHREGRVTLNPLVHIDLIGTIVLPAMNILGMFGSLAMIGWAKPVYTNPANLRHGYRDQAIVTLAGPGMNILLALIGTVGAVVAGKAGLPVIQLFHWLIQINVGLAVFNMLPIPPLDGSKFLMYLGAMREETYRRISMFGGILLLVLINFSAFRNMLDRLIRTAEIPLILLLEKFSGI